MYCFAVALLRLRSLRLCVFVVCTRSLGVFFSFHHVCVCVLRHACVCSPFCRVSWVPSVCVRSSCFSFALLWLRLLCLRVRCARLLFLFVFLVCVCSVGVTSSRRLYVSGSVSLFLVVTFFLLPCLSVALCVCLSFSLSLTCLCRSPFFFVCVFSPFFFGTAPACACGG